MPDPNEVVTVYRAKNPVDAQMVYNALQDEGIQCHVAETNDPFPGVPSSAPDVMVHASDFERARAIIEKLEG